MVPRIIFSMTLVDSEISLDPIFDLGLGSTTIPGHRG